MGDRAQIKVLGRNNKNRKNGVFLYTHWGGEDIAKTLQKALKKRWRWQDPEYLTRIIFDVMTDGDHGSETGFGIGTAQHGDIEHPLLVVDCEKQTVQSFKTRPRTFGPVEKTPAKTWTFEEFIAADLKRWEE